MRFRTTVSLIIYFIFPLKLNTLVLTQMNLLLLQIKEENLLLLFAVKITAFNLLKDKVLFDFFKTFNTYKFFFRKFFILQFVSFANRNVLN